VVKQGGKGADGHLVRSSAGDELLRYEDLALDTRRHSVRRGARPVELTPTEFKLLELFLRNPSRVLTRTDIVTNVWGYDFGPKSNVLNVYVGYLRRKLEAGGERRLVHTVRGIGYMLDEPSAMHRFRRTGALIDFFSNS
jgi:two-component system response regulator MprA